MARETRDSKADRGESRAKGRQAVVSLADEDAITTGLFGSGPATIVESEWAEYGYGGTMKPVPVWLVTYERDDEKYEQPYSLGKGWKVARDGALVPLSGQTGLPKSCNARVYLVASLKAAGMPREVLAAGDPGVLVGAEVVVKRVAQEKREGLSKSRRRDGTEREDTILEIEEIVSAPWDEDDKGKGKTRTATKSRRDEDEAEDEEPPSKKAKGRAHDDEEEEEPARRGAKGKKDNDRDADDDDDDLKADAIEALMEVLDAGPLKRKDIEAVVVKLLKKNPNAAAIAAICAGDEFLEIEKGWVVNGQKVELKGR